LNVIRLLPVILSSILMAAHFSRANQNGLAIVCLLLPFLLLIKRRWVAKVFQVLLLIGAIEWIQTTLRIVHIRQVQGEAWARRVIILGMVALFTALSALVFESKSLKQRFRDTGKVENIAAITFLVTALLLSIVQIKVVNPIILLERFFPTLGWIEIFLLALYARWIAEKMLDPFQSAQWRHRIWLFFSIIFFSQLILGLIGFEKFLMTGKLHVPVPAMIVAGPLYRGERFFMLILFISTVILVGPAWCSHLCYIGAWDNWAARQSKCPQQLLPRRRSAQIGLFLSVVLMAILLRIFGVSTAIATILGIIFGIIGIGVMIFWSRKKGLMTHCITYCPIGVLATWLGKINPFRIKIDDTCTECQACHLICRYDSLKIEDIKNRRPGITCTLCGDCIGSCKFNSIEYRFLKIKPETARSIFIVMVVVLHAVFLGVARI
jgi:NAD-dependent dihydropyrimidine dehydrogenase PreA subunit